MNIYSILQLCGGLAFFLFGMHVMSGSLEKLAGGNLHKILKEVTSNPVKSLFFGAIVTIAIQSSSALTVMLVGLVNSGIMELAQTVGVIMGSNIGTTLTAWILSLSGIESDNLFISMLKPENFSPVIALIGVIMIMGSKKEKRKDVGIIMAGFAVLMYGMQLMSGAVSPLADMPEFTGLLTTFNNPFLGVLVGAVFTGVIQSSAASVGVLQALAMTGAISYSMAIPIIMGQNIGTCVTALLSSIGVNKNAKRVSIIHISFNLFGTAIGLVVYCIARYAVDLALFNDSITPVMIAVFHSIFNIATTIILLPFSNTLVKIAKKLVTTDNADGQVVLDERLLLSPGLAVKECLEKTNEMAELARDSFKNALDLFDNYSDSKFDDIEVMEERLDYLEDQLDTFLIHLSGKDVSEDGNNEISKMLHAINDFERIGDHASYIAYMSSEMHDNHTNFSQEAWDELNVVMEAVREEINLTCRAFLNDDKEMAQRVAPLGMIITSLCNELKMHHVERLSNGNCGLEEGTVYTDILNSFNRIAAHCASAMVALLKSGDENPDMHIHDSKIYPSDSVEYYTYFKEYRQKYEIVKNEEHMRSMEPEEVE